LDIDTDSETVRIPERRILKGAHLLALPCYDFGNTCLTLLDVQRARGTAQAWTPVVPSLRLELKALDLFLGTPGTGGRAVCKTGIDAQEARSDLWEAFEYLRLLCARPEAWEARFQAGLTDLLTPRERLALPGAAARVAFVSSDATLVTHAACDWAFGVAAQEDVTEFMMELRRVCGNEDDKIIIALGELLGLAAFAAQRAGAWKTLTVIYGGDNQVVLSWLRNRAPRNRYARLILRILAYLEAASGFTIVAGYVRTYHNAWPDLFSRSTKDEFLQAAAEKGLEVVSLQEPWQRAVQSAMIWRVPVFLGQDPEDDAAAAYLRLRRLQRLAGEQLEIRRDLQVIDLGLGFHDFDAAWADLRAAVGGPSPGAPEAGVPPAMVVTGSLGPDRSGSEGRGLVDRATASGAVALLLEGPEAQSPERLKKYVEHRFPEVTVVRYTSTSLGDPLHRRRWAMLATYEKGSGEKMMQRLELQSVAAAPPCGPYLAPRSQAAPEDWVKPARLVLDPRRKGRTALDPRPEGHVWMEEGNASGRQPLVGTGGPSRTRCAARAPACPSWSTTLGGSRAVCDESLLPSCGPSAAGGSRSWRSPGSILRWP